MVDAPLKFQLGIVTYNIAANWDLATILRILSQTKIGVVEFRKELPKTNVGKILRRALREEAG